MHGIICSILIPVHNGQKYIEKTIQSCLHQSIKEKIEIIIIDDFSTDGSYDIIQNMASIHTNIVVVKNEKNSGIIKSVNLAASLAKGKYLMFLGHDDMLIESHIEIMVNEFDDDVSFVHCNSYLIDGKDSILSVAMDDTKQRKRTKRLGCYLAITNVVHSTGAIIRKKCFDGAHGWDERYVNYGEWLLWIKLASIGRVKYCSKTKALYRKHDTNITNTFSDKQIMPELFNYFQFCQSTALNRITNPLIKLPLVIVVNVFNILKNKKK
jgi:glycosyltransferase involved in cell wall biosynthesis